VQTHRRPQGWADSSPLQRASWSISRRNAAIARRAMLMRQKPCSTTTPPPPRGGRHAIAGNICRCTGYEPLITPCSPPPRADARAPEETAMLELRKDISPTSVTTISTRRQGHPAPGHASHVTGTSTYFNDHKLQHAASEDPAQPARARARPPHRHGRSRAIPGVRRIIRGADVPRNLNTLLSLINFARTTSRRSRSTRCATRASRWWHWSPTASARPPRPVAKVRVDYEPLPRCRRRGSDEGRPPVVTKPIEKTTFVYHDIYDHQKLRFATSRRGFASADHALEQRFRCLRLSTRHRNQRSIAAPDIQWALCGLHLDPGAVLLARHLRQNPRRAIEHLSFIGGTSAAAPAARSTPDRAACGPGAMLTGRPVRYMLGREEEMHLARRAARSAST